MTRMMERLRKEENRQQQRSAFRFRMAANARKAEREGLGASALDKKRIDLGNSLEDKDRQPIGEAKSFSIELHTRQDIEKLLLSLKFHIFGK